MGGGGAEAWLSHPFSQLPSAVPGSSPYAFLQPLLHQRGCARGGHPRLNCQGYSGASSTSVSGLLQPSVLWKTAGSWRPVIDLSHLNRFVDVSHFQMETIQSVLLSVRQGDWMASIDLKEAYLQVPVHPESRPLSPLCFQGSRPPAQNSVLWPLHGSAGLLSGHGSCFRHSPRYGYPHAPISR